MRVSSVSVVSSFVQLPVLVRIPASKRRIVGYSATWWTNTKTASKTITGKNLKLLRNNQSNKADTGRLMPSAVMQLHWASSIFYEHKSEWIQQKLLTGFKKFPVLRDEL